MATTTSPPADQRLQDAGARGRAVGRAAIIAADVTAALWSEPDRALAAGLAMRAWTAGDRFVEGYMHDAEESQVMRTAQTALDRICGYVKGGPATA